MTDLQSKDLEYPFTFDEIEWRVLRVSKKNSTKAQVAAYVDSRAIQYRLDKVVGRDNWQNEFTTVTGANNDSTAHICALSIYYPERKEWITKSNGAGCTDVEPIKGGLSNAFKRAASMWGIGRYLYSLKNLWADLDEYKNITNDSYDELKRKYEQFVNRYLKEHYGINPTVGKPKQQNQPKNNAQPQPLEPPPAEPLTPNIPNGRFAGNSAKAPASETPPPAPMQNNACRIVNLQVTQGKSKQTLVVLENAKGKQLTGYIQGEPKLQTGQIIYRPKITTKTHPAVGDYNIIESYDLAA